MTTPTIDKTLNIYVDATTITKDIQLLFTFEDMPVGADYQNLAWRVADVGYNASESQMVPVRFTSTLGFGLATMEQGKYITPGKSVAMGLQDSVEVVLANNQLDFSKISSDPTAKPNQIVANNQAGQPASLAVGYMDGIIFSAAAYDGAVQSQSEWVATYTPTMKLYVTSDAKTGQTLSTIQLSNVSRGSWDMADPTVVDQSNWLLTLPTAGYTIAPYSA